MKEKNIKLSIVVPNYNKENYLNRSISCLLNQTYRNVEIIVVNDGSTNDCDSIVNEFTNKDKRVKYINNKDNKGIFHARLAGADKATGDYIAFLDADDYVSVDFYRSMIANADINKSDIVIGNTIIENLDGSKIEKPLKKFNFRELTGDSILNNFFEQEGYHDGWFRIWNKIYSMDLWKKARKHYNNIKDKLTIGEDIAFSTILFYYARKVTHVDNDCIYYCNNSASYYDVQKIKSDLSNLTTVFDFLEKFMKEVKIYNKYSNELNDWKAVYSFTYRKKIDSIEFISEEEKNELTKIIDAFSTDSPKSKSVDYLNFINTQYDERFNNIKKQIADDKIKCISFDIFDTLILRPFYFPTDLFRMLDPIFVKHSGENSINYSKMRIESEKAAREKKVQQQSLDEDVTLDEIYESMHEIYFLDKKILNKMKQEELDAEVRFCQRRNSAFEIYQLALSLGKKVICISDMYLPKNVISKMLKKCGYDIEDIYMSCEIMKTKATGTLFEYALEKEKISCSEMIHIGDNYESDYNHPQRYGIQSIHLIKTIDALNSSNNMVKIFTQCMPFWQDNRNSMQFLGVRTMLALVANKYFDNPYRSFNRDTDFNADPYLIGYYALGMYNYAITRWLLDNTNDKYDKLIFMARDGYLSMETYDILKGLYNNPAEEVYLYFSRKSSIPILISDKFDFYKLSDLVYYGNSNPKKLTNYLKRVMDIPEEKIKKLCLKNNIEYETTFKSIKDFNIFITLAVENFYDEKKHMEKRNKLYKYFDDLFGEKNAVFDVGYSGRPEFYLSKFLKKPMDTFFLNVNCDEAQEYSNFGDFKLNTFFPAKPTLVGNAYELLVSKMDPSCIDYDTSKDKVVPVFEKYKSNYVVDHVVDTMQKAAIEFTRDLYEIFKEDIKYLYYQDYYLTLPIMAYFNSSGRVDKDVLGAVIFEDDIGWETDKQMINDMEMEAKGKNQKSLDELLLDKNNEINNENKLDYNVVRLSDHNKVVRLMYYTLFDRATLKRRIKDIKKRVTKK